MNGSHLIKAYSRIQSNIAISSGDAEFYALVATASEAVGIVAMTDDFGDKADAYLYADASAAIAVANREGLGRIRHLDTQSLWLQQALRKRRLGLGKVLVTENPSDLMTEHVDSKLLGEHVRDMGCEFLTGWAELTPQVVKAFGVEIESEDDVNYVDDTLSGLMTTSMGEQSTTQKHHCAMESEACLCLEELLSHRSVDDDCDGGDNAGEGVFNRLRGGNMIDRDGRHQTSSDKRLFGHPQF